jgi:hypothetical protein
MTTGTEAQTGVRADRPLRPTFPEDQAFKIIGLGGVGGIVARYAALYLASLGRPARLVLMDGDSFATENGSRMFFRARGNKASRVRADLLDYLADSALTIQAIEEFVTPENIGRIVRDGDIVIAALDNHASRKLISDHCAGLKDVCLISGGNDGVGPDSSGRMRHGTYGNCQVFQRRAGRDETPSLTASHPEIREPADRLPTDLSCTELLASTPQILFANLMTASAILNALWLVLCDALPYAEVVFDIADGLMRPLPRPASVGAGPTQKGERELQ